jgi:hypothetical protein
LTSAAVAFLDGRLTRELSLFEFGSGGSTAWYGRRVARVTSVEHDRHWYDLIKEDQPSNVDLVFCAVPQPGTFLELVFRPLGAPLAYARAIENAGHSSYPNVVVIDGVDRLNCIEVVSAQAPASTVLVVDNLEYSVELAPAIDVLTARGYKRIDFWGVSPGELRMSDTAVFYRTENCFGI